WAQVTEVWSRARRKPARVLWQHARREMSARFRQIVRPIEVRSLTEAALWTKVGIRGSGLPALAQFAERGRGRFFVNRDDRLECRRWLESHAPEAVAADVARADRACHHVFDLLGSGPVSLGARIDWHRDFKTGRRWPLRQHRSLVYRHYDGASDIKVPWELSRFQHLPALGLAYSHTGDARYPAEFQAQVDAWLDDNPYARGVNWACPMDVALRAWSWMWAYWLFEDAPGIDAAFWSRFLRALFLHGRSVSENLEFSPDVNGNHYLADGVGLLALGLFFGPAKEPAPSVDLAPATVFGEMEHQVHEDGVDFEQSIPYHRLVTEFFLTGALLAMRHGLQPPSGFLARLERMLEFTAAYTRPDGQAPVIGDADDGRLHVLGHQAINDHRYLLSTGAVVFRRPDFKTAASRFWEESFWLLGPAGARAFAELPERDDTRSRAFAAGGFFIMRAPGAHVVVDCGDIGLRGRGGHGHNDTLAIDVFYRGAPLLVDSGCYVYTASPRLRNAFRSTAAHNTVVV